VPVEIVISDFPTQLEPLISAGTCCVRSLQERGVQASGSKGQVASEVGDRRSQSYEFYVVRTHKF